MTSWSLSHLTKECCRQGWVAPAQGSLARCWQLWHQRNETSCHGSPEEAAQAACREGVSQLGLGLRARMGVHKQAHSAAARVFRELLTRGAYTRLNHFEEDLGSLNSTVTTPRFLHLALLTVGARASFIVGVVLCVPSMRAACLSE